MLASNVQQDKGHKNVNVQIDVLCKSSDASYNRCEIMVVEDTEHAKSDLNQVKRSYCKKLTIQTEQKL